MGGTDDPENLVELSVEEHAEAHRILYEEHGNIKDYCAWKGLEGTLGKEEIIKMLMDPTGRKHSEETKEKMRQSQTGRKRHTPESRKKISDARKGKKLSEEHKRKIGEAGKGQQRCLGNKLSEEHKQKLSEAGKGNTNYSKHPKLSDEERARRSEAKKEYWRQYRLKKAQD